MPSMLRRLVAGAAAGAAGTLAMDLVLYRRYRDGDGEEGFTDWEFSTASDSFDDAGAPGQVAKKAADAVGIDLPEESAGTATNVVHWLTGVGYGLSHALVHHDRGVVTGGLLTGVSAFGTSYLTLGAMGVYEPIWTYDMKTLAKDLSAHLAFGAAAGLVYRLMAPR